MHRHARKVVAIAAVAAVLAIAGCSSDTTDGPAPTTSDDALSPQSQEALDAAFVGLGGSIDSYPSVDVEPGKSVGVISCGESIPTCALNAKAAKEAADAAGWEGTIYDGKLTQVDTAMRQAVADGVDVMLAIGINCSIYQPVFQEVHDAGIVIVSGGGVDDCSPKIWDAERGWLADKTLADQFAAFGTLEAEYAAGKTNGDVRAVALEIASTPFGKTINDAAATRLKELDSGEIIQSVAIGNPEVVDGTFVQKVMSALLAQPDANVLFVSNDAWITNGLGQAIVQAGLSEKLLVVSINFSGDATSFDLLRGEDSGMDATVAYAGQWGQWGSIDSAVRVFAGAEIEPTGEPIKVVDRENNLPPVGANFDGGVDYKSLFLKAWGKG